MGVNSLPKTVTRQRRDCDLNPGPSAPESSTLTTRLPSHPDVHIACRKVTRGGPSKGHGCNVQKMLVKTIAEAAVNDTAKGINRVSFGVPYASSGI